MLNEIRSILWETHTTIWEKINDPNTEPEVRAAARDEFAEVNHRLQILVGKELEKVTASLQTKAEKVNKAKEELDKVLEKINKAIDLIKGVTRFLKVVDDFIDTAKPLFKVF